MATVLSSDLTLVDAAKREKPGGREADMVEVMEQQNGIIKIMDWEPTDEDGSYTYSQRTSLPSLTTRVANQGVPRSKSTAAQGVAAPERVEGYSEVDEFVAKNPAKLKRLRTQEAVGFAQAANQQVGGRMFYGNDIVEGQMNGLRKLYASSTGTTGKNIIKCGGGGSDNATMWLLGLGPMALKGLYRFGNPAGLQIKDLGMQYIQDGENRLMKAVEQFVWDFGIVQEDWTQTACAVNIDVSDLLAGSGANLLIRAIELYFKIRNPQGVRLYYVMNSTLVQEFHKQARNDVKLGGQLRYEDVGGRHISTYMGVPLIREDQLLLTESTLP